VNLQVPAEISNEPSTAMQVEAIMGDNKENLVVPVRESIIDQHDPSYAS